MLLCARPDDMICLFELNHGWQSRTRAYMVWHSVINEGRCSWHFTQTTKNRNDASTRRIVAPSTSPENGVRQAYAWATELLNSKTLQSINPCSPLLLSSRTECRVSRKQVVSLIQRPTTSCLTSTAKTVVFSISLFASHC